MQIVITGATGLIGKPLCAALLADGHTIIALTRNPEQTRQAPAQVKLIRWDGHTPGDWSRYVDGADAVINLAGAGIADGRWNAARKQSILQSRVLAGQALTQAIQQAQQKPKVLIQASAVGYYGPSQDQIITEQAMPGNDFLASVCFAWEGSTAAVSKFGIRRPILRTGIVLSNAGGAFPKMALPFRLFAGGPVGRGKQWLPWIHIDDEIRAIQFLLNQADANGPFNLSAPYPVTNQEFGQLIGKVMGRPALIPTPAFALRTVFGEMATLLLDGQRAVPQHLQELGFTFRFSMAEAALENLLK